jgi:hypothetical protein
MAAMAAHRLRIFETLAASVTFVWKTTFSRHFSVPPHPV